MTNEEAIVVLEDLKYQFDDRIAESEYSKDKDLLEALQSNKMASKALDMAIKALEQEPCEDAISRQYLLDNCVMDKVTMPYVPVCRIKDAPPVTPQLKIGRGKKESFNKEGRRIRTVIN